MEPIIKQIVLNDVVFDYYISNMGIVYDSNMDIVIPKKDNRGYLYVRIHTTLPTGQSYSTRAHIHRLVALAFIPNPNNLPTVNHLSVKISEDGTHYADKEDNRWFMLEWSSYSDNNQHAIDNKLRIPLSCEQHQYATLTNEQVISVCELLQNGSLYEEIIEQLNLKDIPNIKRKLIMIKNGYAWKDISKDYNFSEQRRAKSDFTEENIHTICKMLEQGETDYGKILDTINVSDTRLHRKTISTIKTRKKYRRIGNNYKW